MDHQAFLAAFPRLLSTAISSTPTSFHGFLNLGGQDYEVHIEAPYFPYAQDVSISTDMTLLHLVQQNEESMKANSDMTLVEYLRNLQENCTENAAAKFGQTFSSHLDCFVLLQHLEAIGWSKISSISTDFSHIRFHTVDSEDREHLMDITLTSYPEREPTVKVDMPKDLNFRWDPKEGLKGVVQQWEEMVQQHQELWNVLDELDETARILDPVNPTRKHTKRRILLKNFITIQITVSVQHPWSLPQCQFLGASQLTRPLVATLTEKFQEWDTDRSIVNNLESILGVSVVRKTSKHLDGSDEDEEDWGGECIVCYSLHLEDKLPEKTCDQCLKSCHLQCLYEWLRGLPTSRQSMNLIFGECPYCTKAISCKVPS